MASADDVEDRLLQQLDKQGEIEDSRKFADSIGVNHDKMLGDTIKSLLAYELITTEVSACLLSSGPVWDASCSIFSKPFGEGGICIEEEQRKLTMLSLKTCEDL